MTPAAADPLIRFGVRLAARHGPVRSLLHSVQAGNLSFVGKRKLRLLAEMLLFVRAVGVEGSYVEAGVALGGSAIVIGKLKPAKARLRLYDVFEMIPPPGANDGADAHERYAVIRSGKSKGLGDDLYYGYRNDLPAVAVANLESSGLGLERNGIELIKGRFEDTLFPEFPIAFAHVDCDWHDPVRMCIERIFPNLSPGGVMVFDDYMSYAGCRKAVDAFLAECNSTEVLFRESSLALRKVRRAS